MRFAPTFRVAFHDCPQSGSAATDYRQCDTPVPEVQLLSNGRFHVLVTSAVGGSGRWKNLPITRWCEDATSAGFL
jgi:cyclic beta-1,2-glucan synthetase